MVLRHDDVLVNMFKIYYDYVIQELQGLQMEVSGESFLFMSIVNILTNYTAF